MTDLKPVTMPSLSRRSGVELMHTGQFNLSTGTAVFTTDDLRAAVTSQECAAVRPPVLKLGHTDPRFDGEPAIGQVVNIALSEDGRQLVGDYVGMPGWLGPVMASAYPDRSIEGQYGFTCQLGHTHDFVLTAVALLGVTAPGIGTLASIGDVAALYGVAATAEPSEGVPVTLTVNGSRQEVDVPEASQVKVAASVSAEDLRRAFNSQLDAANDMVTWIEEIQVDPLQLIVVNDVDGSRWRVPVTIDGDVPAFADPVQVAIQYEDVGSPAAVAASTHPGRLRLPNRQESRPARVAAATDPANITPLTTDTRHASGEPTTTEEHTMADSLRDALVIKLGLPADVSDEELNEKLAALDLAPVKDEPKNDDAVVLDKAAHADLVAAAAQGREAFQTLRSQKRDAFVSAAVQSGKIPPARADHYKGLYDRDEAGTREFIDSLATGVVPVAASGYQGTTEPTDEDKAVDDMFADAFGLKGLI